MEDNEFAQSPPVLAPEGIDVHHPIIMAAACQSTDRSFSTCYAANEVPIEAGHKREAPSTTTLVLFTPSESGQSQPEYTQGLPSRLSYGAIVGIVTGGILFASILWITYRICWEHRRPTQAQSRARRRGANARNVPRVSWRLPGAPARAGEARQPGDDRSGQGVRAETELSVMSPAIGQEAQGRENIGPQTSDHATSSHTAAP